MAKRKTAKSAKTSKTPKQDPVGQPAAEVESKSTGPPDQPPPDATVTIRLAADEKERKAYFQPFVHNGRPVCGAPRRNCNKCGYKFAKVDRLRLNCPDCGADRRCLFNPTTDKTRCRWHFGNFQKSGTEHPNYKHGRNSKLNVRFPPELQRSYENALRTMATRNVFGEMGVFVTRIDQLSARLNDSQETDSWWIRLGELEQRVRTASQKDDEAAMHAAMNDMLALARRGATEAEQWRELLQLCKDLASLKQVQAGIEKDHKAYLSMTDAMSIVTAMANAVREALILVRDQWKQVAALLSDQEFEELVEKLKLSEDELVREQALREWQSRLPSEPMRLSFAKAEEVVQRRLHALLPDSRGG